VFLSVNKFLTLNEILNSFERTHRTCLLALSTYMQTIIDSDQTGKSVTPTSGRMPKDI
jgi:hypothetical protein